MSDTNTPNLGLPYLDPSQAQPEVKINNAWNLIDAFAGDAITGGVAVSDGSSPPTVARAIELVFVGASVAHETGGRAVVTVDTSSGGGGGSVSVSDGTTTVSDVIEITFSGATVTDLGGGSVGVSITGGGGGGAANITPDTHPTSPTVQDDEFEFGSSIDTSGARSAGATPWTAFNISTGSTAVGQGSLSLLPALASGISLNGYSQPVPGSGAWEYTAKISTYNYNGSSGLGIFVATSGGASGKLYTFNFNAGTSEVQHFSSATGFAGSDASGVILTTSTTPNNTVLLPCYMRIGYDGTNLSFSLSMTGVEGSFAPIFSVPSSTYLGAPGLIGIGGFLQSASVQGVIICDWFRRTA